MFRKTLIGFISLICIVSCIGTSGEIKTQPNLVSDTKIINKAGEQVIKVYNSGGVAIKVHNISVKNQFTTSVIADEAQQGELFCNETVLSSEQYCTVKINISANEEGVMELLANSELGPYPIDIKIDTAPDGNVLAIDEPVINTTKVASRNLKNLSNSAIKINKLSFEKSDSDIKLVENHCDKVEAHGSCNLKVQVTNNKRLQHKLLALTNNPVVPNQVIRLNQATDNSELTLVINESQVNYAMVESPMVYSYQVKNIGGSDLNIKKIMIDQSIGEIVSSNCKRLSNNDICDIKLSVNSNAAGSAILHAITDDDKIINIATIQSNLEIKTDSIIVHQKGDKVVDLYNDSNFNFELGNIATTGGIGVNFSDCFKINAHSKCAIHVIGSDKLESNTLTILGKNSNYSHTITVTTTNGMLQIQYQGLASKYYDTITKINGKLFAVFIINNDTHKDVNLNLVNTYFTVNPSSKGYYQDRPCEITGDKSILVHDGSCELIEEVDNSYEFYKTNHDIHFEAYQDNEKLSLAKSDFVGGLQQSSTHLNANGGWDYPNNHNQSVLWSFYKYDPNNQQVSFQNFIDYANELYFSFDKQNPNSFVYRILSYRIQAEINFGRNMYFPLHITARNFIEEHEFNTIELLYDVLNKNNYNYNVALWLSLNCNKGGCDLFNNTTNLFYTHTTQGFYSYDLDVYSFIYKNSIHYPLPILHDIDVPIVTNVYFN